MPVDCAPANVAWGHFLLAHAGQISYTEGPQRMTDVHHPGGLPMRSDCSSTCTCIFCWSGSPDPNGMNYDGEGNTDSLMIHGKEVALAQAQPGNTLAIYFNGQGFAPADSVHVSMFMQTGAKPMMLSHGSDPIKLIPLGYDSRPCKFYRFDTMGNAAHYPPGFVVPVTQRIVSGMAYAPTPAPGGVWLCYQGRKAGIPDPTQLAAIKAHAIPLHALNPSQLAALTTVRWGSL